MTAAASRTFGEPCFCKLMERLREIQALSTASGVILFDPKGKLRYVNEQALELIPSLNQRAQPGSNAGDDLPAELIDLVKRMVSAAPRTDPFAEPVFYSAMMTSSWGIPLSLQGIPLVSNGEGGAKKAGSPPDIGGEDRGKALD